ncbi:hypothetical protein BU24DRAFT_421899 [Aaosphaeria arxii CBS 175.79]|uniref:Uncharacterized protein n=1 Tax=Aaosphaeria arxii CBS 175.79 TaxID=1450172 RepID=A0A6A5XRT3_9PLEO|nr:uncharacterized protein BU24DRAFT_421899 [Aaosphaeria arxii CBS 175.79]KAF2015606.1 hypothetical protein BU24DRAFT_421899 [Aaosphaeria arxii CBS 175.79]
MSARWYMMRSKSRTACCCGTTSRHDDCKKRVFMCTARQYTAVVVYSDASTLYAICAGFCLTDIDWWDG